MVGIDGFDPAFDAACGRPPIRLMPDADAKPENALLLPPELLLLLDATSSSFFGGPPCAPSQLSLHPERPESLLDRAAASRVGIEARPNPLLMLG